MKDVLQRFEGERKNVQAEENVRRAPDYPSLSPFPANSPPRLKAASLRSASVPPSLNLSFSSISPSLPLAEKKRLFRQALEQTVHRSSLLISNRIEAEFGKELHTGIRQRLAEIEKDLKEELETALGRSKAGLRNRLKDYVQEVVRESRAGDGSDHDLNMRDSQPIPFFAPEKAAVQVASRKEREEKVEAKRNTKAASYLRRFLDTA